MGAKIDIALYYRQKEATIEWFHRRAKGDIGYAISTIPCYTMVPCIVVACWIGESVGFSDELINKIRSLIDFYDYTEISNTPDGFPVYLVKS